MDSVLVKRVKVELKMWSDDDVILVKIDKVKSSGQEDVWVSALRALREAL